MFIPKITRKEKNWTIDLFIKRILHLWTACVCMCVWVCFPLFFFLFFENSFQKYSPWIQNLNIKNQSPILIQFGFHLTKQIYPHIFFSPFSCQCCVSFSLACFEQKPFLSPKKRFNLLPTQKKTSKYIIHIFMYYVLFEIYTIHGFYSTLIFFCISINCKS